MDILLAAWLFLLGACIGSFLNVVILRIPAGESIVHGSSHCPKCGHAIRWFDNVPILSWLVLRGRCRDCRQPISSRYPVIELVVASLFLTVGWFEPLARGANLPSTAVIGLGSAAVESQLWLLYAYHMMLLATLVAVAVIALDGNRLPVSVLVPAVVVGLLGPALWSWLHPVPAVASAGNSGLSEGFVDALFGAALGGVMGLAMPPVARRGALICERRSMLMVVVLCGLFLGWLPALAIITVVALLLLAARCIEWAVGTRLGVPCAVYGAGAAAVAIVLWRNLDQLLAGSTPDGLWARVATLAATWGVAVLGLYAWRAPD